MVKMHLVLVIYEYFHVYLFWRCIKYLLLIFVVVAFVRCIFIKWFWNSYIYSVHIMYPNLMNIFCSLSWILIPIMFFLWFRGQEQGTLSCSTNTRIIKSLCLKNKLYTGSTFLGLWMLFKAIIVNNLYLFIYF